jgi:hypothetical protein
MNNNLASLPQDVIHYILKYLSIVKHHGKYCRLLNLREYTNIRDFLQIKQREKIVYLENTILNIRYMTIFKFVHSIYFVDNCRWVEMISTEREPAKYDGDIDYFMNLFMYRS